MTRRRVAVTGLGLVSALGRDVASTWAGLAAGRAAIGKLRTIDISRLTPGIGAEVADFDPVAHFKRSHLLQLDRAAQFALVAARDAWTQAALPPGGDGRRRGVVFAASMGQVTLDDTYRMFHGENAQRLPPLTVPRVMPNAACSQISMEWQLRGPSFAVSSACASANHAIAQAASLIRAGQLDVAVTGGADAPLSPGTLKGWEGLRVLAPDACRPFSADRAGLVPGEGAAVLILEGWDHAAARGAMVLAELAGAGMTADGGDLTAPDPAGAADAMAMALDDAGLRPEDVGYVNAHGTGTRLNDPSECDALHRVFGAGPPPVSSTKSMLGHCMAAAGALEAVATVMALRSGVLPPTAGFTSPDPKCDIDCIPNLPRRARAAAAISNSLAFGGLNAVVAFRATP